MRWFPSRLLHARRIAHTNDGSSPGNNPDLITVRWSGYLNAPQAGTYYLLSPADGDTWYYDFYVNGTQIFSNSYPSQPPTPYGFVVNLNQGMNKLVVHFSTWDNTPAQALEWGVPGSTNLVPIPTTQLYPAIPNPASPAGSTAAVSPDASVGLSWTGVSDSRDAGLVAGYDVYRGGGSRTEDYTQPVTPAPDTNTNSSGAFVWTDTPTSQTAYDYTEMTAFNNPVTGDKTHSSPSNETSASVGVAPSFMGPAGVPVSTFVIASGSSSIHVYWPPSQGATQYKLFRSTTSGSYSTTPVATTAWCNESQDAGFDVFQLSNP